MPPEACLIQSEQKVLRWIGWMDGLDGMAIIVVSSLRAPSVPDMEFVTSGTSGTCEKYSWVGVKFSRINAKNYQFGRICQIQSFHKIAGVTLYWSRLMN